MKIKKYFSLALALTLFSLSSAHAIEISALGGMSVSNYNINPTFTTSSGIGWGGGAAIGVGFIPFITLESGVLFLTHPYTVSLGTSTVSTTYTYTEIPLLFRFAPISLLSIGVGPYYSVVNSTAISTTTATATAVPSTGTSNNDYGLMASVSVRIPLLPLFKLRGDVNYEYGFANVSTGTGTQNARHIDILLGAMLEL